LPALPFCGGKNFRGVVLKGMNFPHRLRKVFSRERFFFISSAGLVFLLDQSTKQWCLTHLQENFPTPWLDHFLYLTLTANPWGAFSLFPFPPHVFIFFTSVLLVLIFFYALLGKADWILSILLGMLAGGGFGNLLDRIRYGYVIDFLDLRWWPVFNVADSAISVSTCLIVIYLFLKSPKKKS
jgi:signal peptidase II